jgi:hypothetical protein
VDVKLSVKLFPGNSPLTVPVNVGFAVPYTLAALFAVTCSVAPLTVKVTEEVAVV